MNTFSPRVYEFGDFRLDATKRFLQRRDGSLAPLTPRVFETLLFLVEHNDRVLDKQMLMDAVWPDCVVEENNLAQHISTLRRVLEETPGSHRFIVTVPGRGYRFVAEVRTPEQSNELANEPESEVLRPQHPTQSDARRSPRRAVLISIAAILVLSLAWVFFGRGWMQDRTSTSSHPVVSERGIAVLPFVNLSPDLENEYFADGVKDEILTRLSKIAALKVISSTSTQRFKSAPGSVRDIASQLGVVNILEGSVQKSGETVRLTVQLIHAPSDTHIWAETYDRKLTDIFQVETEVAQRIATALEATLSGPEQRALAAKPTASIEAHQAYLKGRYFWNKRTSAGYQQAIEHFNRAIEMDPSYAEAYAGLADAFLLLSGDNTPGPNEVLARGRAALDKAIELDETLAEAHATRGLLAMNFDWNWAMAEREFNRAIELNPNYATAHQWRGEFLAYMGRFDEGIAAIERAHTLDPLSLVISTDVGKAYMMARRYDEAIAQYHRALEMDPDFALARGLLGLAHSLKGESDTAVAELGKIRDLETNPIYFSWLGYVYGIADRKAEAQSVANRLHEISHTTYVSPYWLAVVHVGLDEKDRAFQLLDQVFAEHAAGGAITLKVNPVFDPLRSDPRFAELLRRAPFAP